jgi:dihydroorotase-like cyclic amidohydrolase
MKLIQNIDVYAPQHLGKKDVLTINDKIVNIAEAGSISADGILSDAEVIDGNDLILTPGFIDSHVHVLGGGGEGGFAIRYWHTTALDCKSSDCQCGFENTPRSTGNCLDMWKNTG